ncbi:MAG: uroporphyrinogen decarboxylase [Rhodospirillaceae bacterium]|nr:uroporphyrinogen decarboxylase [Rhodospirillaceae bacterium]
MTDISKPFLRALRGERIDPPPVWLMRQAGRYLPEYRAVREQAGGFLNLCYDPVKAAEVTLQPLRRFGFDAAILFSDILVIPHAMGQDVRFEAGEGPRLKPIRDAGGLAGLSLNGIHDSLDPIYGTVERVAEVLPDGTALIGFAGAPWTVATYMVEGCGSRDYPNAKGWALGDPDGFQELIDLLVQATSAYLIRQVEAGAEALQLFDTWAGVLPKHAFERFSAQPIIEIAKRVKAVHTHIPIIAFPRGAAIYLPELARAPEIDGIGIDYATDPDWAAREIQPYATVQGNFDPILLMVGGEELERRTRSIVNALSGGPHIFNLGHGILPKTPIEHVERLLKAVRG